MSAWMRREGARFLEVLGIAGLVVTQPVLQTFQDGADVFVLRDAGPGVIVAFALVVALAPATLLWGIGALAGLAGERPRAMVHRATLGGLGGLFIAGVVDDLVTVPVLPFVGLVAGAGLVGWATQRFAAVPLLLRYLAGGTVLFVGAFLFASPVTDLLRPGDVAPADVEVSRPAPVVMVVLDELPTVSLLDGEGRIDEGRFPNLAALADDATWYRNHSTVAPLTPGAVPALLTGQLPEGTDEAPVAAVHPDNLFTLLGGSHDVRASETLTELCPPSVCAEQGGASPLESLRSLLGTAVDVERAVLSWGSEPAPVGFTVSDVPSDPEAAERLVAFADSLGPSDGGRPRLDYVHVMLPHQPWDLLASGEAYEAPDPPEGTEFLSLWEHQALADVGRQRHVLQLQYTDRLVGDVVERLRRLGTYDESLVVVTADHGVAFTQDAPIRGADELNVAEIMWTPLFVKAPGQDAGNIADEPMQSVDVLGVIAGELGVEIPWDHGSAAIDAPPDDERLLLDWRFHGMHPDDGDFLRVDGGEGFGAVLAHRPVGEPGDDPLGLYRLGQTGDLIGSPVGGAEPLDASLSTVGAYVAGTAEGEHGDRLGLVVGDVVVATPILVNGRFAAMVPDRWRPERAADVRVVRLSSTP